MEITGYRVQLYGPGRQNENQYGRGDSFGTKMVNENEALPRKRRRGPTKMNGGKTYAFSWLATFWAKTLTPPEPGVGKAVKWWRGEPEQPIWTLESRAMKSKVCGPKRFSNFFHGSRAIMQSLSDKTRERASAWLRGEGTNCKQREIFWARRVWNNSLRASFSGLLLPPCFSLVWISTRQSI